MPTPRASRLRTAEVALLDSDGVIVAVNAAWDEFCLANGGDPRAVGPGVSYLEVCDRAGNDPVAADVAGAIVAALGGDLPAPRRVLVPCPSPTEPRWFDLLVSSRLDDTGVCIGATVTLSPVPAEMVTGRDRALGPAARSTFAVDRLLAALARHDRESLEIFVHHWLGPALDHDARQGTRSVAAAAAVLDLGGTARAAEALGATEDEVRRDRRLLHELCHVDPDADPGSHDLLALGVALRAWQVLGIGKR
ncbi:MAG: hypothetical protein ACTHMS_06550 [Jatrophihabitans sp.]|uniref:hypothetical protein n=1 Tax=Jatrophihabitans sp. TaxID=1932789 RepID=UPI003F7F23F5